MWLCERVDAGPIAPRVAASSVHSWRLKVGNTLQLVSFCLLELLEVYTINVAAYDMKVYRFNI